MAEKNYNMIAVVPEMPRTIDGQQLHVYVPVGSKDNYGVFKPDGQQFVIVGDGVLRVDASKLIQLAEPPATVVEDGGATDVGISFTDPDNTLNRKFKFTFKNIKGPAGPIGDTGLSALQSTYNWLGFKKPAVDTASGTMNSNFNRTPVVGDTFLTVYRYLDTDLKTILGVYLVTAEITQLVPPDSCDFKIVKYQEIPINYIKEITGPVSDGLNDTYTIVFSNGTTHDFVVTNGAQGPAGPTGEQGPKGDNGVSVTSVTQVGVDGGTLVTITLSDGQSTSFVVKNGINTQFTVVQELPTIDISTSTIYLVPSAKPGAENIYDEYIYVNGNWEHIGSTTVDLSDYVTKTYFNQNVGDATKNYLVAQLANVHNLYIEMFTSGSAPEVGQGLALSTANFARAPSVGQYFGLVEVVNDKDKYYTICKITEIAGEYCNATVEAVTMLDSGTDLDAIRKSIADLTAVVSGKLNAVTGTTDTKQVYAKNADGTQTMLNVGGTASDDLPDMKALADYVANNYPETITIPENGELLIKNNADGRFIKFSAHSMDLDGSGATSINIDGQSDIDYNRTYIGDKIYSEIVVGSDGGLTSWTPVNAFYEIKDVPTSATSGTLPDDISWVVLWLRPFNYRILFNEEFYQLADNEHTAGTLVYSHVGYESGQLFIKTITITIATRGWVLTTVKPSAYHIELSGSSGTITDDQLTGLTNDTDSYVLITIADAVYKLCRNVSSTTSLRYSTVSDGWERRIVINPSTKQWSLVSYPYETTTNKTTSISASPTNQQYPSAAAVKTYVDTAIANAITTTLNTAV